MISNETIYNKEWEKLSLEELGKFSRGKSKHRPRDDERLFGDKYPFIQTGDVKNANLFIKSYSKMYNDFGLQQSKLWDKGTLCITIAANIAETAILGLPACFPDSVVGFTANKEKTSEIFMHYLFCFIKSSIQNSVNGSIQDNINIDYLEKLKLMIPSKEEQDKIVNLLYNLDKKIEININIKDKLNKLIDYIFRKWFIHYEFPNDDGVAYKTNGGEMYEIENEIIPIGWKLQPLGNNDLCKIYKSGLDQFENEKIYIATSDVINSDIINNETLVNYEDRPSRANMQPKENTIWFAKMKSSKKTILVSDYSKDIIEKYIFSTGFMGLECRNESLMYLWSFINTSEFEEKKDNLCNGSTQKAINNTNINNINLIIPSDDILCKFNDKIYNICKYIYQLDLEREKLIKLRDMLIPKLMSGNMKID